MNRIWPRCLNAFCATTVSSRRPPATACRLINALRPDLILLDIKLPELDGLEVCRLVRKIPDRNLAGTPIMMLSALATQQDCVQGLKLGANNYMTKPYSLKEIMQRSIQLIDERKAQQLQETAAGRTAASASQEGSFH